MKAAAYISSLILALGLAAQAFVMYPPHPFCDEVDAAWRAKDYEQIGILIEERLAAYPDDPMALSMACHYHVFIDRAPDKFAKYVARLRGVANRYDMERIFEGMLGEMFDTSETILAELQHPLTKDEITEIAKAFPKEFPGSSISYIMAKFFLEHIPRLDRELRDAYESFLERTKVAISESQLQLRADAAALVASHRPPDELGENLTRRRHGTIIPEDDWTPSISNLRPQVVYWSEHGIRIAFYKFLSKSEGIYVYAQGEGGSSDAHTAYSSGEMVDDGIYWYSYSH